LEALVAKKKKVVIGAADAASMTLLERLQKRYGPESVMFGKGAGTAHVDVEVVSTGSLGLDMALGVGGFPFGRIVEVYGPEASGKTTLCLHVIAQAQELGATCAVVDAEHALDLNYAENLGVDPAKLLLSQPDSGEHALELVDGMIEEGVRVIVIDSVAALTPQAELDGEMGDSHVGLQARLMGQALRKIRGKARRAGALVIFVNQLRMKIGVMFGSPETTTGGRALRFYASVRIDLRKIATLKKGDEKYGNRTRLKVVKNKLAPPFQEVELDCIWGLGFDISAQLVDIGTELGVLEKSGNWFSFDGERIGNGRPNAIDAIRADPEMREDIRLLVVEEISNARHQ
jgi:recombination protein RecA